MTDTVGLPPVPFASCKTGKAYAYFFLAACSLFMCAFMTLIAMKGLSGAMGFFSKVVPLMVVLTVGIGIAALIRFGFPASLFGFGNLISVLYPLMDITATHLLSA